MKLLFHTAILFFMTATVLPQNRDADINRIFANIEEGLPAGSIDRFSNYFAEKTFISLFNGKSGYFSANQAYYVLKDFFSIYRPISFKIDNLVIDTTNPFASGALRTSYRGIRKSAMVFISLQKYGDEWRISQITIN
ncbi:MAG: DUF4783 domain-containing protein [Melioribacter sp.]|uniref:DUF4783 domain-containing protein n=1 Tax=Melioribacter sp. TaxID=2052167 RepID=UPI003BE4E374